MRKTTYARRVDQAGRVIIPVKLRMEAHIAPGDLIEFYVTKDENGKAWLCFPFGDTPNALEQLLELE